MSDDTQMPAAWHPDPYGRHEHRWWDGYQWTDAVSTAGRQTTDAPGATVAPVTSSDAPERIQQQVARAGAAGVAGQGGGTIFTEPILVVNQKAKLMELNAEYAISDQNGTQIGAVRQVGQSTAKKVLRVVSSLDQYMTHTLQVVDRNGAIVLTVTRPAKFVKSKVEVKGPDGNLIGVIAQENMMGKIRFGYMVNGQRIGGIQGENWRAWNFALLDHTNTEVARITKTFEGIAKTLFTTADNYVCQIHRQLESPLRELVVASALTVDLALKQDSRGLN